MDSPFSSLGAEEAKERRQGQRRLLKRIFDCAKEENCDLILLAGDVFDSKYVTPETEALFLKLLEESTCPTVICAGNHDPYAEGSFYQKNALPEHTYLFTESALTHFDFPELGARVYGYSFRGVTLKESPLSLAEADTDFQGIRLLCAHGDLQDPLSKYGPITVNDIVKFNINYAALGHVHKAPDAMALPTGIAQYCGIPEGRSFDETGECGVWLVTVEEGAVVSCLRRVLSERQYRIEELDVSACADEAEILERIGQVSETYLKTQGVCLRLRLVGCMAPDVSFEELVEANPQISLQNETVPVMDGEALKQDVTIRGALYRVLYPDLISGDPDRRLRALRALQIGLAAADEREIPTEEDLT